MRCTFYTSLAVTALFAVEIEATRTHDDDETALYQRDFDDDKWLAQLDSGLLADDLGDDDLDELAEVDANSTSSSSSSSSDSSSSSSESEEEAAPAEPADACAGAAA